MTEIKLPELGEGIDSATVIAIIANAGDTLNIDDPIIEIETDKAVVPVPTTEAGVIEKIMVQDGDTVKPGDTILQLNSESSSNTTQHQKEEEKKETPTVKTEDATTKKSEENIPFNLPDLGEGIEGGTVIGIIANVGDNVNEEDPIIELETDKAVIPVPSPATGVIKEIIVKDNQEVKVGEHLFTITSSTSVQPTTTNDIPTEKPKEIESSEKTQKTVEKTEIPIVISPSDIAAGPGTRKLARELDVNLVNVNGTGRGGRITMDDLKMSIKSALKNNSNFSGGSVSLPTLPDFSQFGSTKKEKISKLRKTVSDRMTSYWTIPHVHQFNDVDVTKVVELQKKYAPEFKEQGSALSPTQFIIKAMVEALKKFPLFNASFDHINSELIIKEYYNIGVAVDTPTGLIVPVMKGVDKMSIFDIGKNLKEIAQKTRERKIAISDLQGAGMTLSNLGGIGGTSFTPIINYPEVAILGTARGSIKPVFINGEFQPRTIMNVCLAYDHRVIDGADGARFIKYFTDYIENIEKNLLI